jgi:hypothetical protein
VCRVKTSLDQCHIGDINSKILKPKSVMMHEVRTGGCNTIMVQYRFCLRCSVVALDFFSLLDSFLYLNPHQMLPAVTTTAAALPPLLACHPVWPSATFINCAYITQTFWRGSFSQDFLTLNIKRL